MLARQLLSSRLLALIFSSGWRGRITHNKVQATQRLHAFACVYPSDNTEYKLNFSLQYFMMWMGEWVEREVAVVKSLTRLKCSSCL